MGVIDWARWNKANPEPGKLWARKPCSVCGAASIREARDKCRPIGYPSGDSECGPPEEAPTYFGWLHDYSDEWLEWDGRRWQAYAVDEGLTKSLAEGDTYVI